MEWYARFPQGVEYKLDIFLRGRRVRGIGIHDFKAILRGRNSLSSERDLGRVEAHFVDDMESFQDWFCFINSELGHKKMIGSQRASEAFAEGNVVLHVMNVLTCGFVRSESFKAHVLEW